MPTETVIPLDCFITTDYYPELVQYGVSIVRYKNKLGVTDHKRLLCSGLTSHFSENTLPVHLEQKSLTQ